TLDADAISPWAKEQGIGGKSLSELARDERVVALIKGYIDKLNATLAKHETIKKFAILPADLTLEAGELTPSLNGKRKGVEQNDKGVLEGVCPGAVGGDVTRLGL